jgi:hypothetical protein
MHRTKTLLRQPNIPEETGTGWRWEQGLYLEPHFCGMIDPDGQFSSNAKMPTQITCQLHQFDIHEPAVGQ